MAMPSPPPAGAAEDRRFPRSEFEARLARLRAAMRRHGVEVMLLDDCEVLNYFTGYDTSLNLYRACLVPLEGQPVMVLRALDAAPFLEQAWFADHVGFADTDSPPGKVAETLAARGFARAAIGFDPGSHAMSVASYEALRAALPEARFVPLFRLPWELRLVKSPAEIARIGRAAAILDRVMGEIVESVEPGVTERQVAAIAARRFLELGGDPGHVGPITAGRGWDFLHAPLHDRPLGEGDVLHLELVSRYAGYNARLMRCLVFGPIEPARRRTAERLIALQDAQLRAMRPGSVAREVDAILREGALREGLRPSYPNITGYTLGYYSKLPLRSSDFTRTFDPAAEWRLEPGMAFHMYASAEGVSISETVVVREGGAERLTRLPRRLFSTAER
jgi:Xaa-Pro dipeptidase